MARILIVEDNAMNRLLVRAVLEHRGHDVVEARDAEEGRARAQELVPDAVLLDVQIPGGGGEQLLRELREDPRLAGVPVIAVTALAMQGDRERFLRAGFDGYLSKPIDTRTFAPEVESFIETRGKRHDE